MALHRRVLSKLSQRRDSLAESGPVWRTSDGPIGVGAGGGKQEQSGANALRPNCQREFNSQSIVASGGLVANSSDKRESVSDQKVETCSPRGQQTAAAKAGGHFSQRLPGRLLPPLLHQPLDLNSVLLHAHSSVRHYRTDRDQPFHFGHAQPFQPLNDHSAHEFRGLSSEPSGLSPAFSGAPSGSPPNPSLSTPPHQRPPESARRTLLYGALAALLLSGGAAVVANGDVTPGKVLNTDPRAVMRSASQSMRGAAHEVRARAREVSGAAAEQWEELSAATSAMTSSAGALASCLVTVLWGPLEEMEDVHSRGRSLLRARIAALIADFAANRERRNAIACAGDGKILRWLLGQVSREEPAVRNEAARALGYFLDDKRTAGAVLAQRGAVPQLLRYCDMLPRVQMLPPTRDWDLEEDVEEIDHAHPGQRLLVASLAKLVAGPDVSSWTRGIHLSSDADPDDIAAALQEMRSFERDLDEEEERRKRGLGRRDGGGVQGIGIRVLGDTSIVGVQRAWDGSERVSFLGGEVLGGDREGFGTSEKNVAVGQGDEERKSSHSQASTSNSQPLSFSDQPFGLFRGVLAESTLPLGHSSVNSTLREGAFTPPNMKTGIVRRDLPVRSGPSGLGSFLLGGESSPALDEINLGGQLATWAVATWAAGSPKNREQIARLDGDGGALEAALRHPDPSVQFHAARAIEELAKDQTEWAEGAAATWTPPLLGMLAGTLFHDPALPSRLSPGGISALASTGVRALGACANRSPESRGWLGSQGLGVLRRLAADERLGGAVQRPLAGLLELLTREGDVDMDELKFWIPILLKWTSHPASPPDVRALATATVQWSINALGADGKLVMEAWLATLLSLVGHDAKKAGPKPTDAHGVLQNQAVVAAKSALDQLEKVMAQQAVTVGADVAADVAPEKRGWFSFGGGRKGPPKPVAEADVLLAVSNALKALAEVIAEDGARQRRVLDAGGYALLTQFLRSAHFGATVSTQQWQSAREGAGVTKENGKAAAKPPKQKRPYVKRHALRVLANLSIHPQLGALLGGDQALVDWLEEVADGRVAAQKGDLKLRSFAKETLLHLAFWKRCGTREGEGSELKPWPRYLDGIYLLDPTAPHFRTCLSGESRGQIANGTGGGTVLGSDGTAEAAKIEEAREGGALEGDLSGVGVLNGRKAASAKGPENAAQVSARCGQESEGEVPQSVSRTATVLEEERREGLLGNESLGASEQAADGFKESGAVGAQHSKGDATERIGKSGTSEGVSKPDAATGNDQPGDPADNVREVLQDFSDRQGEFTSRRKVAVKVGVEKQLPNAPASMQSAATRVGDGQVDGASGARPSPVQLPNLPEKGECPEPLISEPAIDVVFIHGLMGGAYKTWRMTDDKTSAIKAGGVVEDLREENRPRDGDGCWPTDWLAKDLPSARLLSTEYKTNLTEWSGATLPLQELSAHLLEKLLAAGVGERPVVFVTHSLGGLVAKQMLQLVRSEERYRGLGEAIRGIVFYSCPHFGSRLADLPSRMGVVLRPAAAVGELRSGSPRLEELNKLIKKEYQKGRVDVINFSEDKVTPVVEAYGGVKLRMEVVPIESAYPGFGDLIVLKGTDHVNACKPLNRQDVAYTKTLEFLRKLEGASTETKQNGA